jgi:exonuclease I
VGVIVLLAGELSMIMVMVKQMRNQRLYSSHSLGKQVGDQSHAEKKVHINKVRVYMPTRQSTRQQENDATSK